MDRDLVCGLIGFAIALVYLWAASDIPVSSLGDTVGARGVPTALGYALAGVSALFVGQRLIALRSGRCEMEAEESRGAFDDPVAAFASAAGTVAICAAFIFMFETAGYVLSIALLILALCMYQRVRLDLRLLAIAGGGAFVLWLLFAVLLSVRMPVGVWQNLI